MYVLRTEPALLYFFVGDKNVRDTARTTIKHFAEQLNCWEEIEQLLEAKESQFFKVKPKTKK